MEEIEPTYENIYQKINAKRALLGITEKDFTKPIRKTHLNNYRELLISESGGCMYK